jgi:hypothetical protein
MDGARKVGGFPLISRWDREMDGARRVGIYGSCGDSRSSVPGCGVRGDLGDSTELSGVSGASVAGAEEEDGKAGNRQ